MKVRVLALSLVVALLISVSSVFAQDETIVDIAAGDENFSTLVSLLESAGLVETLQGEGPFTVFAPTNDAFAELPDFVIEYLGTNTELLTSVLTYHVAPVAAMSGDLESGPVGTVEGSEVAVEVGDMGVTVDGVDVVTADLEASNGVIHVIDQVLIPALTLEVEDPAFVEGTILAEGSSTVGPLTQTIMNAYVEAAGGEDAVIEPTNVITGSGDGIATFCAGESDIANASRAIRESEVEDCMENGINPIEFRVGTDGIAVVVNPDNDWADDLTLDELAALFSTATVWADVREGFPEEDILRFTPGEESGTYDFFNEVVFDEDPSIPAAASNLTTNSDDNVLLLGVSENVNAAGYFGYAYFVNNQEELKLLSIDGVQPTTASVESGEYSLARPLFIYTTADIVAEKPQVGEFIKFYLENVLDLIGEVGYFPPSSRGLNLAKVQMMAITDMGM